MPYCETSKDPEVLRKPSVTCITKDSVEPALALLKIIQPELQRRATNSQCDPNFKTAPHMLEQTILEYTHNIRPDIVSNFNETFKPLKPHGRKKSMNMFRRIFWAYPTPRECQNGFVYPKTRCCFQLLYFF